MLTIRKPQLAALDEVALEAWLDRLLPHLQKFFPQQWKELGRDGCREAARHGLLTARGYGIVAGRDVVRFVDLVFAFGRAFDTERSWARKALAAPPQERMEKLFRAALGRAHKATPLGAGR